MPISFDLPAGVEAQLRQENSDVSQLAKEAALVGLYRQGHITQHQIAQSLDKTRIEIDELLQQHNVTENRAMISNPAEYHKALEDLRILEQRIAELEQEHPGDDKAFTKAGVRKMIATINEELAAFVQASVREGFSQLDEGRSVPAAEVFAKAKDLIEMARRDRQA
jgi:hypothetical protein